MKNELNSVSQSCYFCKSEEGKPRPIGCYVVELTKVKIDGCTQNACQSCKHKIFRLTEISKPKKFIFFKSIKESIQRIFKLVFVILLYK